MISNKDIRVEGSNLIINGEKHPLDPAVEALIKRANTVHGKLSALDTKLDAIEALEKSASGNPISLTGVAEAYAMSLSMTIEPIQSGSGDPSPTNVRPISGLTEGKVTRTGKNVLPMTIEAIKAANTSGSWNGNIYSFNDVSFEIFTNSDGLITGIQVNGTASAISLLRIFLPTPKQGNYVINGCPKGGDQQSRYGLWCGVRDESDTSWVYTGYDLGSGGAFSVNINSPYIRVEVEIRKNYTANNLMFYPMIRLATETDPTFEPYTAATSTITFGQTVYGGSVDFKTGQLTVTHGIKKFSELSWLKNNNIFYTTGINDIKIGGYLSNKFLSDYYTPVLKEWTALDNGTCVLRTGIYNTNYSLAVRDDNYNTVSDFTTEQGDRAICYELATPITLTLTPAELELLKGNNTITANGAEISIEYIGR